MILDMVAVGDSTVDVVVPLPRFLRGNEDSLHSTGLERHMGGSSNYLIAASRLGLRVGVADAIGGDDLGAFYRAGLEAEGIDTSQLVVREGVGPRVASYCSLGEGDTHTSGSRASAGPIPQRNSTRATSRGPAPFSFPAIR